MCIGRGGAKAIKGSPSFINSRIREWEKAVKKDRLAPSTRKGYTRAWELWNNWITMAREEHKYRDLDPRFPTVDILCSFIYFYCIFYQISTVKGYVRRAGTVSKTKGGLALARQEWEIEINRTYKAAAKAFPQSSRRNRRPLTVQILKKIKPLLNPTSHNDRALWALLSLGVFTLARIGELVPGSSSKLKVTRKSIEIRGDHGILRLVGTKTDHERKGVQMHFFRNKTECCPVEAMNAYLTGRTGAPPTSPLFVDDKGRKMTQAGVVTRVRGLLEKIGLDGKEFSGISLRRGGAQTLLRLGATDKVVMGMGRWASSCYKRYLVVEDEDVEKWQFKMASTQ